eukprot:Hpha_TRINITY_DN15784_c1_g8::TRINITY_DN15784_c1_g8_i1::g.37842::m.37842
MAGIGLHGLAEAAGIIPTVLDQKLFALILDDVCGSSHGSSLGSDTEGSASPNTSKDDAEAWKRFKPAVDWSSHGSSFGSDTEETTAPKNSNDAVHDLDSEGDLVKRDAPQCVPSSVSPPSSSPGGDSEGCFTVMRASMPPCNEKRMQGFVKELRERHTALRPHQDQCRAEQRRRLSPEDSEGLFQGLHTGMTKQELRLLCGPILGQAVTRLSLSQGDLKRYRTLFAFIEFNTREAALCCVQALGFMRVKDNVLRCSIARNPIYAGNTFL